MNLLTLLLGFVIGFVFGVFIFDLLTLDKEEDPEDNIDE